MHTCSSNDPHGHEEHYKNIWKGRACTFFYFQKVNGLLTDCIFPEMPDEVTTNFAEFDAEGFN